MASSSQPNFQYSHINVEATEEEIAPVPNLPSHLAKNEHYKDAHEKAVEQNALSRKFLQRSRDRAKSLGEALKDYINPPPAAEPKSLARKVVKTFKESSDDRVKGLGHAIQSWGHQFTAKLVNRHTHSEMVGSLIDKQCMVLAGASSVEANNDGGLHILAEQAMMFSQEQSDNGRTIVNLTYNILFPEAVPRESLQQNFRLRLLHYYDSKPSNDDEVWCPVTRKFFEGNRMTAGHIVPYRLGYNVMGDLFGEPGNGVALMWSLGNGLVMHKNIEKAFDRYEFALLPVEKENEPRGWKFVLVNEALRHKEIMDNL